MSDHQYGGMCKEDVTKLRLALSVLVDMNDLLGPDEQDQIEATDLVIKFVSEELSGYVAEPDPGRKNWDNPCCNCGEKPTVGDTGLCGPCCFGEAETVGGNW